MAVILMYHMVRNSHGAPDARFCCSPRRFKAQMGYLKRAGYKVISLSEIVDAIKNKEPISRKTVALTFDDGFRDNYKNALPILKKHSFPATLFTVSGLVNSTNIWMERRGFPKRDLVSWKEIREMAENGFEIGSHTVTHAALDELGAKEITRELVESKAEIERQLQKTIKFFAYPYGRLNEYAREAVCLAGYEGACSTRSGFNNSEADPFILRRIEIYGSDSLWQFALKIAWGTNDSSLGLVFSYYLSRVRVRFERWFA